MADSSHLLLPAHGGIAGGNRQLAAKAEVKTITVVFLEIRIVFNQIL